MKCCSDSRLVCRRSGGSVLVETSVTIQFRDRALTICPCSGCGEVVVGVVMLGVLDTRQFRLFTEQ